MKLMTKNIFYALTTFALVFLLFFHSQSINPTDIGIGVWNILPLLFFSLIAWKYIKMQERAGLIGRVCFVFVTLFLYLFPLAIHLLWLFDDELGTSSSTAGLVFIFIPFWALFLGAIPSFALLWFTPSESKTNVQ